ncbi:MAG: hypothetical protein R2700_15820 [Solirubrobacterales bacterium]
MEAEESPNDSLSGSRTGIAVCAEGAVRRRIRHALAEAEEPIAIADDVEELLDSTLQAGEPPACVILVSPRIDAGFGEVVAKVHDRVPSSPILTVSRRAGAGDVRRAIDFGVDGVVLEEPSTPRSPRSSRPSGTDRRACRARTGPRSTPRC